MARRVFDYTPQSDQPVEGLLEKIAKATDEAEIGKLKLEAARAYKTRYSDAEDIFKAAEMYEEAIDRGVEGACREFLDVLDEAADHAKWPGGAEDCYIYGTLLVRHNPLRNFDHACSYLTEAAGQGHLKAQMELADYCLEQLRFYGSQPWPSGHEFYADFGKCTAPKGLIGFDQVFLWAEANLILSLAQGETTSKGKLAGLYINWGDYGAGQRWKGLSDEAAVALAREEAGKPHKELPAAVKEYVKKEDGRMDALRKQGRTQVAINLLVNGKLAKEDIAKCAGLPLDGVEWLALRFQAEQDA